MIASQESYVSREVQLDSKEQKANFNTIDATIYIVTKKQVVESAWFSSFWKHVKQVSILSMNVPYDTDWLLEMD